MRRLIVRETMMLVCTGIAIGLPLALISGRIVRSMLFGLSPTDPLALGAVVLMLLTIGLLAGYLPGRRASRVQPLEAFQQ